MTSPGSIVHTKVGSWTTGNLRFFDYTHTSPTPGMINVGYIRDLPSSQLSFLKRPQTEVTAIFEQHKNMIKQLQGFVTMTDTLAKHIIEMYDLPPDMPYMLFRNYPNWRITPDIKRDEFVYIGAIPVKFDATLKFLSDLKTKTGFDCKFIKRKYYENNPLTDSCMHVDKYDYGSRFGLLINENKFPQAEECLPRKILLYLMCGIYPVFHDSFVESINYCKSAGVDPVVYSTLNELVDRVKKHDYTSIDRPRYSMEMREHELVSGLKMLEREITDVYVPKKNDIAVPSHRRKPVTHNTKGIVRRVRK